MNDERVFLDSNIVVYAYDRSAGPKHEIARRLLIDLWNSGGAVLSTQVLQELYVTITRKVAHPLPPETAREIVSDFLSWEIVANDGEDVLAAIEIQMAARISFWDALIIAAARKAAADVIISEDLADGRRFGNVVIRNPFPGYPERESGKR